jgi:hypothetical protein
MSSLIIYKKNQIDWEKDDLERGCNYSHPPPFSTAVLEFFNLLGPGTE